MGMIRTWPLQRPITLRATRFARDELPDDPNEFSHWLTQQWYDIDRWIADHTATDVEGTP
jgi:hypothetical protein